MKEFYRLKYFLFTKANSIPLGTLKKTVDIDIKYSTGHTNGSVYGLPAKLNSITPIQNLFFCGTDQGFLGIVGTTLSSISMANLHIFAKKVALNP